MMYALSNNIRVKPQPKKTALCPNCGNTVFAKCGKINIWHWSHKNSDCDTWSEPESEWHKMIKEWFPENFREVILPPHRADIKLSNGYVVELQHSHISSDEISERENFYKKMIWFIDGTDFEKNFIIRNKGTYATFKWFHPRRTLSVAKKPIYIHLPEQKVFFIIKKSYQNMKSGWGEMYDIDYFYPDYRIIDPTLNA